MSQAATGIFCEVELRRSRLAQSIKEVERDIKTGLAKISQNVSVKVLTTIDPDIQKKLDAAIAKLTVKPITIPVRFVAQGGMPTPGGGGQMPGSGSRAGGGGAGYMNPLSMRGLSRAIGSGLPVYAAMMGMHLVEGAANAYDVESHPERILRQRDGIGSLLNVMNDPFMQQQAQTLAGIRAEEMRRHTFSPLTLGTTSLIDALSGYEGRRQDRQYNAERSMSVHEEIGQRTLDLPIEQASLSREPGDQLRAQGARQGLVDQRAVDVANQSGSTADQYGAMTLQREHQRINDERVRRAMEQNELQVNSVHGDEFQARMQGRSAESLLAGNPAAAMLSRHQGETQGIKDSFERRMYGTGSLERAALQSDRDAQLERTESRQKLETEQFNRDREKQAGDSAARIKDIEASSADDILRARGEAYNASVDAAKRATDRRVAELEREAKAELDTVKKGQLVREAAAVRVAGVEQRRAMAIEHDRQTARQTIGSRDAFGEAALEAGGQHRAARDAKVNDDYRRRVDEINRSNDPDKATQLANAARDRDRQLMLNQHHDDLSDRGTIIDTADANARANGQAHVGEVLSMQAEFEDMERDARGNPARERLVAANEKARIAALKRELRPKSNTYSLEGYGEAIQSSISSGTRNGDALKLLDAMGGNIGAAGAAAAGADPTKSIAQSAKDLSDAANVIKNARPIGFFKRR